MRKILVVLFSLGIIDALYLTIEHFYTKVLVCPQVGVENCAAVLTSAYSTVLGIPIAVLGLVWFIVLFAMCLKGIKGIPRDIWLIMGSIAVAWSVCAMVLLQKLCIYCTALDLLIIASVVLLIRESQAKR